MSNQTIIMLCALGGTIGGAVGAAAGFWMTTKVALAMHSAQIKSLRGWLRSLRTSRHHHADLLQKHEIRLARVEHFRTPQRD